jgi:hypothetical protein
MKIREFPIAVFDKLTKNNPVSSCSEKSRWNVNRKWARMLTFNDVWLTLRTCNANDEEYFQLLAYSSLASAAKQNSNDEWFDFSVHRTDPDEKDFADSDGFTATVCFGCQTAGEEIYVGSEKLIALCYIFLEISQILFLKERCLSVT